VGGTINTMTRYDESGGTTHITPGGAINTTTEYDQSGGATLTVVDPLGIITTTRYDMTGGRSQIDGRVNITTFSYDVNGGTLSGRGTINGAVNNNSGTVNPVSGGNPSTLSVGTYTQGAGGTLTIDLGGTSAGQFGVLAVNGNVMLGGTLDFTEVNGFTLGAGENFSFLTWTGTESGSFANAVFTNFACPAGDTCTDVLGANSLTLEIAQSTGTPTPEPSAAILFGTALAMAAFLGLRKMVSGS